MLTSVPLRRKYNETNKNTKKFSYYVEVMDISGRDEREKVQIKEKKIDHSIFSFEIKPKNKPSPFSRSLKEETLKKIPV